MKRIHIYDDEKEVK